MRSRKKITIILLLVITFSYGINKIVAQTYEELAEETFVITSTDKKYEVNGDLIHISYKLNGKDYSFDYSIKKGVMLNER